MYVARIMVPSLVNQPVTLPPLRTTYSSRFPNVLEGPAVGGSSVDGDTPAVGRGVSDEAEAGTSVAGFSGFQLVGVRSNKVSPHVICVSMELGSASWTLLGIGLGSRRRDGPCRGGEGRRESTRVRYRSLS